MRLPTRSSGALLALLAVSVGACASSRPPPPPVAPPPVVVVAPPVASAPPAPSGPVVVDESFREHPPAPEPVKPFTPPAGTHGRLRNGIPVLVVHQASPFVALRVVGLGGLADVGADHPEVIQGFSLALHAGSTTRNIYAIREQYVTLGMQEPETNWYADAVSVSFVAPAAKMRAAVELAADFTMHSSLDQSNFERWRGQEANRDEDQANDATLTADHVLRRALFGGHPYGAGILSPARTRAVKRADLVALHARVFDPSRLAIVVAGGVDEGDVIAALDDAFGAVAANGTAGAGALRPPPPARSARIVVVDKPGTPVATIATGFVGPGYGAPDMEASVAAVSVLADASFGRITVRLRQELSDVPFVTPATYQQRTSGSIGWKTRAATDKVAPALAEVDRMVRAFAAQGPTEEELAAVRDREVFASAEAFETAGETAKAWSWVLSFGLPDDVLLRRPHRYAALTADALKEAAARYLDAGKMRVVIVGDWAKLREPLLALGWGSIEVRTPAGVLVRTEAGRHAPR